MIFCLCSFINVKDYSFLVSTILLEMPGGQMVNYFVRKEPTLMLIDVFEEKVVDILPVQLH